MVWQITQIVKHRSPKSPKQVPGVPATVAFGLQIKKLNGKMQNDRVKRAAIIETRRCCLVLFDL
jgi:hypothetical protein